MVIFYLRIYINKLGQIKLKFTFIIIVNEVITSSVWMQYKFKCFSIENVAEKAVESCGNLCVYAP